MAARFGTPSRAGREAPLSTCGRAACASRSGPALTYAQDRRGLRHLRPHPPAPGARRGAGPRHPGGVVAEVGGAPQAPPGGVRRARAQPGHRGALVRRALQHHHLARQRALAPYFGNTGERFPSSYLLPQAYPEGAPTHPAYGAGHAAGSGACATILKTCRCCRPDRDAGRRRRGPSPAPASVQRTSYSVLPFSTSSRSRAPPARCPARSAVPRRWGSPTPPSPRRPG